MEALVIEKYRDLLEICDSLLVVNKSEGVLYVSPRSSEIFGINKTELEGKKLVDLFENSEIISKAIQSKDYYIPIILKAKNLSTDGSSDIVVVLQLFDRTAFKFVNQFLGFTLIACKIPEDKVRGTLGVALVFSKEVIKLFSGLHNTLSRSFGGGRFGSVSSSIVLIIIMSLITLYGISKEKGFIFQVQDNKEHSSKELPQTKEK